MKKLHITIIIVTWAMMILTICEADDQRIISAEYAKKIMTINKQLNYINMRLNLLSDLLEQEAYK
jgi:hypothetical protein